MPTTGALQRLRTPAAALGMLAVALAALVSHFLAYFYYSMECSVGFDTSSVPPPADASPQGWLCGEHASAWGREIWAWGFVLSLIATVALILLVWRRWSWRVGMPAVALVVLLPLGTAQALSLPSDECSAQARSTHPAWACRR